MQKTTVKRLIYDLEVSPNVVLAFAAGYDKVINHDAIVEERKIICIGYKWHGEGRAKVLRWDKNKDDKAMLVEFAAIAHEADELIAHFGDRFDMPWFRTRCLFHGLPPLPHYKTVDTKAWASKNFYFNSNKLDYIGSFLGYGNKLKTDFSLWRDITLSNNQKALDKMCRYCARDVELLERVYDTLQPHLKAKTHAGVKAGLDNWTCPKCGSKHVHKSKTRHTASGQVLHQMACGDCGSYHSINTAAFKRYEEAVK